MKAIFSSQKRLDILKIICLFAIFLVPLQELTACNDHINYYKDLTSSKICNPQNINYPVGYAKIRETRNHCSSCETGSCCSCPSYTIPNKTCEAWQIAQTGNDYGLCKCEKECLNSPQNPKYYDDPTNKTTQTNISRINLPVVLAWNDISEWKNEGQYTTSIYENTAPEPNNVDYGPNSYRVEIKYEEYSDGDSNLHIDKNKNPQDTETLSNGQKIFYKIITKNGPDGFNSRDDGGECFFQTNSTYEWRVRPCCDEEGKLCKTYRPDEGWWKFSTSPAPELLGIQDNDKYQNGTTDPIAQDPDWNGPQALEGVDFCSAKLLWCKAKLMDPPTGYNRFDKVYNNNQIPYAANYQMRVKFSENWSLKLIPSTSSSTSSWSAFVQSTINSFKSKTLYQSLSDAVRQALLGDIDFASQESCHYLQKQDDGSCKPEHLAFTSSHYVNELMHNASFKPFFSAAEKASSDRNLFTGDTTGKLEYSWQIKTCFDTSAGVDDDNFPHCGGYNDEDYGQKWQFIGKQIDFSHFEAPELLSPGNNTNCADEKKLVGLDDKLLWTAPCGANSFIYDVLEKNGNSIFKDDDTYANDFGRRITVSQASIDITDKDPVQENDPKKVQLKIDTCYQWKVKSCWPSIPIPEMSAAEICSNLWNTADFRTTGQAPKNNSLKTIENPPDAFLQWDPVSGAKSYRLKIVGEGAPKDEIVVDTNQYAFTYPGPKKTYSWYVRTCADTAGNICGTGRATSSFISKDFDKPSNLSPSGDILQLEPLRWTSNAKYFLVTASVTDGETSTDKTTCDANWFNGEYKEKIISGTTLAIRGAEKNPSPYCFGDYEFTVQPCFDEKCTSLSYQKTTAIFSIAKKEQSSGFMVCGQSTNDPNTKYNEKEPCRPSHLVLTLKIIIDFVVFKLAFMLLPVMVLITGGLFYLSQDKANLIPHIKDVWKKIGIGYGILFFSWIIVSVLTGIVGYPDWYKIL